MILNSYFNPFFDKYLYTRVQFPEEEQYPTINPANMKTIIPLGSKKKKSNTKFCHRSGPFLFKVSSGGKVNK